MLNKRRSIVAVFLFFVFLVAGWKVSESVSDYGFNNILPVKEVKIEGEFENISHDEFRGKVISAINGGYFSLDLNSIRDVLMALPWVDDVSVRRQWPSSLQIKVTEKRAIAFWNNDAMISERGDVFTPKLVNHQLNLPRLNGPEGFHKKVWMFLIEVNRKFTGMGFKVTDLMLDNRRSWSLDFSSSNENEKIKVKLGRYNASARLLRFVRVFSDNKKLDLKNIAVIDLRYPNGFSIKIKNNMAIKQRLVREA